jgi:hypothetical protein
VSHQTESGGDFELSTGRTSSPTERLSRLTIGRWAGIPLCDTLLSADQTRILSRYAATDTAIVVLADDAEGERAAVEYLDDLSRFFTQVQAVRLPSGQAASTMIATSEGRQRLHDVLLASRPLSDYRQPRKPRRPPILMPATEPSQPDQSPSP